MTIRPGNPPRIEWKEKCGARWVGRSLSVTREALVRFGVSAPPAGKSPTAWHAKRLMAALRRHTAEAPPRGELQLFELLEVYFENLRCKKSTRERRERVLRRSAYETLATRPKVADISLITHLGGCPIGRVSAEDLLRYQNLLEDAGYSPMSIRSYLLDVRNFFTSLTTACVTDTSMKARRKSFDFRRMNLEIRFTS
jgi:hypothetical protein